jgi:hypothetical protein
MGSGPPSPQKFLILAQKLDGTLILYQLRFESGDKKSMVPLISQEFMEYYITYSSLSALVPLFV